MNVSEFTDISRATDTLISAVQAFGYTAETSMDVVDLLNKIGNNYAISTADLAQSLTKSSASLVAAGGNLAEAAALTATANKIIQDADSVGTALKTTSLRLRGTSVDILNEEGLDSEGAVTSKSKLQSKVKALSGVDILTATGEYKSTYEILSQIADVWEDINDMDQAALLELISGKRNSSVIAAILQNPKELKEAFEDASNAEGSALKENEKYLDSIQGRIDLFTNAIQTMWTNALDGDVVKWFVDLGTTIVKVVDKLGLIPSILITISAISMVKNKMGPLSFFTELFKGLQKIPGKIKGLITSLFGITTATSAYTAETLAAAVANGTLSASEAASIASKNGLALATTQLTATEAANMLIKAGVAKADAIAMVAKLGLTDSATKLSLANIQEAVSSKVLTEAQGAQIASALGLTVTNTGLAASFKALWTAMWPVLLVMLAITAVVGVVKFFDSMIETSAELEEKLDNLNSEISELESEIESLNSELETTQERMAELLAMDSLSLTEQEELKNLQLQNAELERQIELQEILLKNKEKERANTAKEWIKSNWDGDKIDKQYAVLADGTIQKDKWYTTGVDGKYALEASLPKYAELKKESDEMHEVYAQAQKEFAETGDLSYDTFAKLHVLHPGKEGTDKSIQRAYKHKDKWYGQSSENLLNSFGEYVTSKNQAVGNMESGIDMVLGDMAKIISENELSYSMGDEDVNKFLDEYFAYQYAYQEAQGISAKSSAIASIFDDTSSDSIKNLKEGLSEIASDDSINDTQKQAKALELVNAALADTSGGYDRLKNSMDIVGISAEEVARYFVQMGNALDSSTVEGITAQYQKGVDALNKYKGVATDVIAEFTNLDGKVEQITWGSLFDDQGEAIDTQISKVLQGADETAREEFARIAEAVNEGKMSVDNAIKSFSISGVQVGYQLIESAVVELNSNLFKDLGDEITGLIDTFDEFGSALESVADAIDLVNKAQAEMAYSGHVSVETALALINSTEDWNKVLRIENGNITLVDGAMDILAQSKLNQIKTNLQLALSEAQAGLEQARLAESSGEVAQTIEESTTESVRQLAANMEYLSTLIGEFLRGNFLGAGKAAATAKENSLKKTEYQKQETSSSMSVADWEEKVANIESKLSILEGVDTTGEFNANYSSDKVSGKSTEDAFQKEMDYWENRIGANQSKYEIIQSKIDMLEKQGRMAGKEYYEEQRNLEVERYALLIQQKEAAKSMLGTFKEGSDEWWEVANTLNDIENELYDVSASIQDLDDAIDQIHWDVFDETHERFGNLIGQLSTIRDLLSADEDSFFDDEGQWTENGVAVLGTYIQEIEIYKNALDDVNEEIENLKLSDFDSEQEYYDKLTELTEKQHDYATTISDSEQAVVGMYESQIDAIEEYTSELVNSYNEYIDVVKEALDAERDLYEFKKNVKKQTKDIAYLERRIASLSGSSNASDIAERRKLEAELYDAKEGLNDTYYSHAKDAQSAALDGEADAYEKSMTNYIETLRDKLDEAKLNMDLFMDSVTTSVATNAGTVLSKYNEAGIAIDSALTTPWANAETAMKGYETNALTLMNQWTQAGTNGFVYNFSTSATSQLTSPWVAGTTAVNSFKSSTATSMSEIVSNIKSNVATATSELNKLSSSITTTTIKTPTGSGGGGDTPDNPGEQDKGPQFEKAGKYVSSLFTAPPSVFGSGEVYTDENTKKTYYLIKNGTYKGYYIPTGSVSFSGVPTKGTVMDGALLYKKKYAKGTMGTSRNEWAITDELGDELVLVPGANGNLSFMRKGTSVVPADITANLVEWGKLNPDMLKLGGGANMNIISNAVTKPEFNLSFDSMVHVDHCDEGTLKELEKMVDNKINQFSKQMNYAIKRVGGR